MPNFQDYLKQFVDYLEYEKKRSRQTAANYAFYLTRFFKQVEKHGIKEPQKLTPSLIKDFIAWLGTNKNNFGKRLKKNTQNYHLIALRSFLKFLRRQHIKTFEPEKITLAPMPPRQTKFLDNQDVERLLQAPLKQKNEINMPLVARRDKAILELLFTAGLRVSELVSLKKNDLNSKKDELTVRGKQNKIRLISMANQARYWLSKYLEKRTDAYPWLFIRHDRAAKIIFPKAKKTKNSETIKQFNNFLTPRSVQRLIERYAREAGINKPVTPQTLRHSFATGLFLSGADLSSVQNALGHASPATTRFYTRLKNKNPAKPRKNYSKKEKQ